MITTPTTVAIIAIVFKKTYIYRINKIAYEQSVYKQPINGTIIQTTITRKYQQKRRVCDQIL